MMTQVCCPNWTGKGYLHFALWRLLPGVQLCEWLCFEVAPGITSGHSLSSILETQINTMYFLPTTHFKRWEDNFLSYKTEDKYNEGA